MFPFSSTSIATGSEIIGSAATNYILNPSGNLKVESACPGDKPPVDGVLFFSVLSLQALKQMSRMKARRFLFMAVA